MTEHEVLRLALRALYGFIPYLPIEHDKQQCERYDEAVSAIEDKLTGYAQSQIDKAISYSEVMKQALNVLLLVEAEMNCEYGVTESLRQAIAEAEKQDEPVAWYLQGLNQRGVSLKKETQEWKPLYTKPQQRKPLTRKDIDRLHEEDCFSGNIYEITAEIEAAHGIKE